MCVSESEGIIFSQLSLGGGGGAAQVGSICVQGKSRRSLSLSFTIMQSFSGISIYNTHLTTKIS